MVSIKKIKKLHRKADPARILENDFAHFYLNTGISHDYPNKWTVVHAFLDSASAGDYSYLDLIKNKTIMSYSSYLRELSGGKWNLRDLGGSEITKSGIKAIVKALDLLADEATKLLQKFSKADSKELYNIYRKAYFIMYAQKLEISEPTGSKRKKHSQ